jgi:excisionase family DNA binding protein
VEAIRPLLTIRETATLLALSTRRIHRYIAEGKLKAYRVGGEKTIRIRREDVGTLLEPVGERKGLEARGASSVEDKLRGLSR